VEERQDPVRGRGQAPGPVVHDRYVGFARTDLPQAHVPRGLAQQQGEVGVRPQPMSEDGGEGDRRRRERGDHHAARRLLGPGRDVGLRLLDHGQDLLGVVGQPAPGVGELGAARGPVQQGRARFRSSAASCWDTAEAV
jgi:hypothetical protein